MPGLNVFRLRSRLATADGLTRTRVIYLGVVFALWLFLIVLTSIVSVDRWWSTDHSLWFFIVVLAVSCLTSLAVRWVRGRPLDTSSPRSLATSFMARMFIGIGYAETAAVVAFVSVFLMHALWIYFVGLAFSTINLILVGPTRREIARRQEQIMAQGSGLSLGAALMAMPSGRHGR
jgi:hypothetical protein